MRLQSIDSSLPSQCQGAGGEIRTPMGLRPAHCEYAASTSSATPAPYSGTRWPWLLRRDLTTCHAAGGGIVPSWTGSHVATAALPGTSRRNCFRSAHTHVGIARALFPSSSARLLSSPRALSPSSPAQRGISRVGAFTQPPLHAPTPEAPRFARGDVVEGGGSPELVHSTGLCCMHRSRRPPASRGATHQPSSPAQRGISRVSAFTQPPLHPLTPEAPRCARGDRTLREERQIAARGATG